MNQNSVYALHLNSVTAIAIRDMMERYGRSNIGFLWALVEPAILAVGVMIVWSAMKSSYEHGVSLMTMVFTGYLPLTLWRHITGVAPGLFRFSFSLLYHRTVSLSDILAARILAEFAATTAATLVIFYFLRVLDLIEPMERADLVIAGWLLMAWLSAGTLAFLSCVAATWHWTERFLGPLQYLILPISGIFFMLDWIPSSAREIIAYNPLVHCYELIRDGFFGSHMTTYYTAWYPLVAGAVMFVFAIGMMPGVREELSGH